MKENKINIVITDDHKLFRRGLSALLSDFDFIDKIYEAENGKELLSLLSIADVLPHIVLLDINMPEMDGLETTKKLNKYYPDIKIIILTMEEDEHFILHLIKAGVNGYLLKNSDQDELEKAIKNVIEKDFYFSENISGLLINNLNKRKKSNSPALSKISAREREVIRLVCKENTASEIADLMSVSARTVEGYKRKLLEKTGTKNMAGLVVFAIKNNLVKI